MSLPETSKALPGRSLVVAVLTFRRPQELAGLLPELIRQTAECSEQTGFRASVLVIDNDPEASAEGVVMPAARLRYVCERTPGIAAARNRALAESAGDDLLVFIDDDEWPQPGWLVALVATYTPTTPAAVVGPVESEFVVEPSSWVKAGRFFDRRRLPTGTEIGTAASNNLLLNLHQVRDHGLIFDERFGLSGGSDTLFSHQLVARGGRIIWCAEAMVVDQVPASRVTARWVLLRALRSGNSWSRTVLDGPQPALTKLARRAHLTVRGGVRLIGGAGQSLSGYLFWSQARQAKGLRTAARGLGMFAGAYGYVYSEYRRPTRTTKGGELRVDQAA
jgi:succinoglycan biosynthesis protein ExoM